MATKFNIKDPNPGVWFKFDDQDPESGSISIRVANDTIIRKIDKACSKTRVEYKNGQRFEVRETNDDLYSEMLWDYVIPDWSGLEDDEGKPLECTTENKLFLMRNNPGFSLFVQKCLEKLKDMQENLTEYLEKNLLPGLNESGKSRAVKPAKS
jgi:hypothetical protein